MEQEVSQVSTEQEVRWCMVHMYPGEVERVESTTVRYLMQCMLPRPYSLEYT